MLEFGVAMTHSISKRWILLSKTVKRNVLWTRIATSCFLELTRGKNIGPTDVHSLDLVMITKNIVKISIDYTIHGAAEREGP